MGGSTRSLSALRHALQLFKACLNKRRRGWDKITVLHAGCDLHQGVLYHVKTVISAATVLLAIYWLTGVDY